MILEKDEGLGRVLSRAETQGIAPEGASGFTTKVAQGKRRRSVPSSSAVFRYLSKFPRH